MSTRSRWTAIVIALLPLGGLACDEPAVAPEIGDDTTMLVTAPGHDLVLSRPLIQQQPQGAGPPEAPMMVVPPGVPPEFNIPDALIHTFNTTALANAQQTGQLVQTTFTGNMIKETSWTTLKFLLEPVVTNLEQVNQTTYVLPQYNRLSNTLHLVAHQGNCGHRVEGNARHEAWMKWGPFEWGSTVRSSVATPSEQGACDQATVPVTEPGSGGGNGPPPLYTCWYLVYYDTATGQVLSSQLLYCESW